MSGTKVDLETLRTAIKEYKSILEALGEAYKAGTALVQVLPAGEDKPSEVYANAAQLAGEKHQLANKNLQDALEARIENLEATLQQYEQTEQGNRTKLTPKD